MVLQFIIFKNVALNKLKTLHLTLHIMYLVGKEANPLRVQS